MRVVFSPLDLALVARGAPSLGSAQVLAELIKVLVGSSPNNTGTLMRMGVSAPVEVGAAVARPGSSTLVGKAIFSQRVPRGASREVPQGISGRIRSPGSPVSGSEATLRLGEASLALVWVARTGPSLTQGISPARLVLNRKREESNVQQVP